MRSMITSIDPGLRACGVAVWSSDGILVRARHVAGAVRKKGMTLPTYANAWREMADNVLAYVGASPDLLVIEGQQIYMTNRKAIDENDLVQVAATVGALSMLFDKTRVYKPSEWKGEVPKFVDKDGKRREKWSSGCTNPMEGYVRGKLSDIELRRIELPSAQSLQHNVFDAVGIGLFYVERVLRSRTPQGQIA